MSLKAAVSRPDLPTSEPSALRFGRAVWAIALRELRSRYGKRRLGMFWALVEPLAYILGLSFILSFVHDHSPLGGHLAPFVATGLMPYMLLASTEASVRGAVRPNVSLLVFPRIKPIDLFLGRWVIETSTLLVVFVLLFGAFVALGWCEPPARPHEMLLPLFLANMIGLAFGIANAVIVTFMKPWEAIWQVVMRINFFTAGIFFLPTHFPPAVVDVLQYQPTLHIIEWVRSGFYRGYQSQVVEPIFPIAIAMGALFFALLMERAFRYRLSKER